MLIEEIIKISERKNSKIDSERKNERNDISF